MFTGGLPGTAGYKTQHQSPAAENMWSGHNYYYCIRLTPLFQDNLGKPVSER